jgi:hypothetical protein
VHSAAAVRHRRRSTRCRAPCSRSTPSAEVHGQSLLHGVDPLKSAGPLPPGFPPPRPPPARRRAHGRAPGLQMTRENEIFRDPPGSGNYSSSIGAAQGIELFGGSGRVRRARPAKTISEPARQVPVFAETDVLVVGGGPAGTAAANRCGPYRRGRVASRALQPPGRAFDRRPCHLDRSHDGLVRAAHHPRPCGRIHGASAEGCYPVSATRRLGKSRCRDRQRREVRSGPHDACYFDDSVSPVGAMIVFRAEDVRR